MDIKEKKRKREGYRTLLCIEYQKRPLTLTLKIGHSWGSFYICKK